MKIYFRENEGLYADENLIANFEPRVIGIRRHIRLPDRTTKMTYEIMVRKIDGTETEIKEIDNLCQISYFDMWNIPDCALSAKQKKILQYKLQQDVAQLNKQQIENIVQVDQGLYHYKGSDIYSFGENIFMSHALEQGISVINETGISLRNNVGSDWQLSLKNYINFFPGVSEMLFYGALFGVIKPILCDMNDIDDMGIKPDFAISLVGPSGHLKTSMVRKYALWLDDSEKQEVSFRDHRRNSSIIAMIDKIPGQNFLVDDLHEARTSDVATRQQEKLDSWVRHIGVHRNSANIFVTGETMEKMGIFSCKDRILQIKIPRKNSEELKELKRKIGLLSSGYMSGLATLFLESLMKNYDSVKKRIREYMEQNLNIEGVNYDTRTYHHGIFIRLTEELFRQYMCMGSSAVTEAKALDDAIKKNCMIQQGELQRECDIDYAVDVYKMLTGNNKYITVVTSGLEYVPGQLDRCAWTNNRVYITKEALVQGMIKYYGHFVSWRKIIDDLDEKALLDEDCDKRGKKFMRKRHYVIMLDALRSYINWKKTVE